MLRSQTKKQKMVRINILNQSRMIETTNIYNTPILFFSFWRQWVHYYVRATGARDNRGGTYVWNTQNSLQHKTVKFGELSNKPSDQFWYLSSLSCYINLFSKSTNKYNKLSVTLKTFMLEIYNNMSISSNANITKKNYANKTNYSRENYYICGTCSFPDSLVMDVIFL